MKKYFIITYGCQMNWSDSERIATVLEKIGYKLSLKENEADLIVINMCSIRQSAVNRVYGKIENFTKSKNILRQKKSKVLLTGCILEKDIRNFKDKVDYIFPIKSLNAWPKFLTPEGVASQPYRARKEKFIYYPNQRDLEFNKKFDLEYFEIQPCSHRYTLRAKCSGQARLHRYASAAKHCGQAKYKNKFSAFVPISTGCDNFCSYCVVPYLRGPEISRPVEDIILEVKNLVKKGYKEVWLLGQNVNSYEVKSQKSKVKSSIQNSKLLNFAGLLKLVNQIPGDFWIRFISPHPKDFSNELIKTMAECEKITPYLNLPVQSGDNKILKKMNRSYTIEQYKNLVQKIRKEFIKIRGKSVLFCLTTDIIVGFPGETKKQFENTVKLFKEIKFDMAYISQYSSRAETAAFHFEDNITQKEKKERDEILTEILKKTALENNKKYIGREMKVLVQKKKNEFLIGKSEQYKTIKLQVASCKLQDFIGKFVKVKITEANLWGLKGETS